MNNQLTPIIDKVEKGSNTVFEEVFNKIKNFIVETGLKPGDKIPTETALASMLCVSRSALREALKSLQKIGILDSKQKEGMVIREFNFDPIIENLEYGLMINNHKLIELMDLRIKLEISFLEEAIQRSTFEQLQRLQKITEIMEQKVKKGESIILDDSKFHQELFSNVDNELLQMLISVFWKVFLLMIEKSNVDWDPIPSDTVNVHKKILKLFVLQETESCRKCLIEHYSLKQRLLDSL